MNPDADAGMAFRESRDDGRHAMGRHRGEAAHGDLRIALPAVDPDLVEREAEILEDAPCARQQRRAGRGQRDLPGGAQEKRRAERFLELADAVAQRRLRQVEVRGRRPEAAALGDADEGLEPEDVNPHADARHRNQRQAGAMHEEPSAALRNGTVLPRHGRLSTKHRSTIAGNRAATPSHDEAAGRHPNPIPAQPSGHEALQPGSARAAAGPAERDHVGRSRLLRANRPGLHPAQVDQRFLDGLPQGLVRGCAAGQAKECTEEMDDALVIIRVGTCATALQRHGGPTRYKLFQFGPA